MKSMVVYDSVQGNTEEIAKAIAANIGSDCEIKKASEAGPDDIKGLDLLVAGSPTYGGRPTPAMKGFLDRIKGVNLEGVNIACFDTRIPSFWVKLFGFAAQKIDNILSKQNGLTVVKAEGFFVTTGKPPKLVDKELERAGQWAAKVYRAAAF